MTEEMIRIAGDQTKIELFDMLITKKSNFVNIGKCI